ncbi:unnamed protein product [Dovyalis caffra]|uniref:Uncharacterized protein n=1 Tax=Dovyalis caffra TaxID=77055 RepID=A0AAV1S197_9ROSI|nr:unnamed protein product [Dovyalis caffra]
MSVLRWNFKANMEKMMSCENGLITLAHGCELAFISLFSVENCFRIPESFPCLHDKLLAAAAEAAFDFSSNQKKKQGTKPGILGGIVKGFKGGSQEVVELDIDDIEIDEPSLTKATTSLQGVKHMKREKRSERDQLLGVADDMKPKLRTPEEIMAKYRKAGDASSAAAHARNKLVERQEKLEVRHYEFNITVRMLWDELVNRMSRRTAELQSGAEDFASLANELVKDASSLATSARHKLVERQEKLEKIGNDAEELEGRSEDYASLANELLKKMEKRKWWQI